jgi:hypothetical protein
LSSLRGYAGYVLGLNQMTITKISDKAACEAANAALRHSGESDPPAEQNMATLAEAFAADAGPCFIVIVCTEQELGIAKIILKSLSAQHNTAVLAELGAGLAVDAKLDVDKALECCCVSTEVLAERRVDKVRFIVGFLKGRAYADDVWDTLL